MKKRTHVLVTKHFIKDLNLSLYKKFWLYFGSIAPDLTPMCLFRPHQFKLRNCNVLKRFYSLDSISKDWLFYFRVGVISHLSADFFTAPHNRQGIKGFCLKHSSYENDLAEFFKCNLYFAKSSKQKNIDFENYLFSLHTDYMTDDKCIEVDFHYICEIISYILEHSCTKRLRGAV